MNENDELKILAFEAKEKADFEKSQERPARENIDALLAEAAERRASRDNIEKRIKQNRVEFRQTEKTLDLLFITITALAWIFGLLVVLAVVKYLFW